MSRLVHKWRILLCFCAASSFIFSNLTTVQTVQAELPVVSTHAQATALIDVTSGRILYSHRGDEPLLIASLTKIMTAIVALEHGELSDVVKVGKSAYGKEGSSIYLQMGEEMSLHHLLYGLMLRSGNDAAVAIAEHVGGSVEGFVYLMNEKAAELGLSNTHFMNPHGLDHPEHYSTANDLAKLTAYALKNKHFQEIVKTKTKRVPNPHHPWDYTWYNKNKMLSLYEGADGVKTGYTKAAGRGLVSSATRNGQQLAVVTINDPADWADHAKLLDYGFQHYTLVKLVQRGHEVNTEKLAMAQKRSEDDLIVAGKDFVYPLTEEEAGQITYQIQWAANASFDQKFGLAGRLNVQLNGHEIGQVPLFDSSSAVFSGLRQSKDFQEVFIHVMRSLFTWSI